VERFRPEAILFDVGGTLLLEESHDLAAGVCALLADPALPTREGPAAGERLAGELTDAIARAHAQNDELPLRDWLRGVCEDGSSDALRAQAEAAIWRAGVRFAPAPGVHDLLDELAADQLLLAAVSNSVFSARVLAAELERHGLRRAFPCVVSSADVGRRKPDAAPFREALRRLRIPAARAWHVGDTFAWDVAGAARLGLAPVWLSDEDAAPPGGPPHLRVRSLDELRGLFLESQRAAS